MNLFYSDWSPLKELEGASFLDKNGFDRIIGVWGDKKYSETAFSIIGLKKELL